MGDGYYLQTTFPAKCHDTGHEYLAKGRKWYISKHSTETEVMQTALKAVLSAEEHEAREQFRFMGVQVFHPHYPLDKLVNFCINTGKDSRLPSPKENPK